MRVFFIWRLWVDTNVNSERARMHVISASIIRAFTRIHPGASVAAERWLRAFKRGEYRNFGEIKRDFPSVDLVGGLMVFNLSGNHYRLIVKVVFARQKIYVRNLLTHAEYSKDKWKEDSWFDSKM